MKKTNWMLAAMAAGMLLMTACGSNKATETTETKESTAAESTAPAVSAEDPEVKELEALSIPPAPELKDMGSITLPELSGISVSTAPANKVTEEDLEIQIKYLLSMNMVEAEVAENGDVLNIDYAGTIDGVAFSGGTAEGQSLELGSGTFIPGFEDQLIGAKKGEKRTVKLSFPEDYAATELAGKPAEFAVTVNEIQRVPELTDEWVKAYEKSKATSAEEFREEQRAAIQANYDYSYHSSIQRDALQQIAEKAEIQMSDVMKRYTEDFVTASSVQQAKAMNYSLADMLNASNMTVEDFKKEMALQAEQYGREYFVVHQIAEEQKIQATEELLDSYAGKMSALLGEDYDKERLIREFGREVVESSAVNNAVMEYIESKIRVSVEESDTATDPAGQESAAENAAAG